MKKTFILLTLAISLFSCQDYIGDINYDQDNRPDYEALAPNKLLAGAINNFHSMQSITLNSYGQKMAYSWGLNYGYTTTDAAYSYDYTSGDYGSNFESAMIYADNFQDILDKEEQYPTYSYHFAVAKIFKVMCFDYLTALYGDVPYTEALNDNIETPRYDDDKTIIPKLFQELDAARELLNNPHANVVELGSEDIIFHGDIELWKQFLNTVELKLALRLSKTTDAALVTLRNERFDVLNADPNFIMEDVTINPGFNSVYYQRNPLFRTYAFTEGDAAWTSSNRANAAGDYAAKLVNGTLNNSTITTGVVDPRRTRIFTTVGGTVVGNVQGSYPSAAISRFGSFYFGYLGTDFDNAVSNGSGRDGYLMQLAESEFLQAEAVQRGFLNGDAHQSFINGVTASFNFYSRAFGNPPIAISTLNPTTYLNTVNNKNGLGWDGSADKINAIMTQKYLALINWNGIEMYFDNLRTGYPVLPLPANALKPNRPYRLIYPNSEYSSNSANTPSVTNDELFTVNGKTPYYLQ